MLGKKIIGVAVFIRDITERKRAEADLRRVGLYNRRLIEASLDPLVTIGPEGKITDVNEATTKVTGYPREKLIGSDFSTYFTEPEKAREGYQFRTFAKGQVTDYPLEVKHSDGHSTPVLYNATVYQDEAGHVVGVFAAARDITERRRAEAALREREHRYRSTLDGMLEGCQLLGHDWRYLYINAAAEAAQNRRPIADLLGQRYMDMWPGIEATEVFVRDRAVPP